jgi:hypothetical protein
VIGIRNYETITCHLSVEFSKDKIQNMYMTLKYKFNPEICVDLHFKMHNIILHVGIIKIQMTVMKFIKTLASGALYGPSDHPP